MLGSLSPEPTLLLAQVVRIWRIDLGAGALLTPWDRQGEALSPVGGYLRTVENARIASNRTWVAIKYQRQTELLDQLRNNIPTTSTPRLKPVLRIKHGQISHD
ncbi:hypothetical protein VTL71DRAFT_3351 [Oculimacula yallundae]|uniref:Uncharacterized protein n=1 Tax=Oculimacula yallundae TaxID=86028 RepID=A0ABR4C6X0_9HELO